MEGRPLGKAPALRKLELVDLSAELIASILLAVPLRGVPLAAATLRLVSSRWRHVLDQADDLWLSLAGALQPAEPASGGRGGAPAPSRRSPRLRLSPRQAFTAAVRAYDRRTETLHHSLAVLGQDTRKLAVGHVRHAFGLWAPVDVDRVSPVYDATMLMEICRARGCTDAAIAAAAQVALDNGARADVGNGEGLTPLILASGRGLRQVVALLLRHGADPQAVGLARFRTGLVGLRGRHSAVGWVRAILAAARGTGFLAWRDQPRCRDLHACLALLEASAADPSPGAEAVGGAA